MSRPSESEIEIEFDMTLESHNIRKCPEKSFMVVVVVVCSDYSVISMSRPSDSEIEIEFYMTLETFGVDMDRVWSLTIFK